MSDNSRVRVSIVGVVIVALFSALLVRLWFLQMGPEQDLRVQAVVRSTRVVQTEMPRGRILDRFGKVLAQDRVAWAVTVDRDLGTRTRTRVIGQLAELLGTPYTAVALQSQYDSPRQSPLKPAIVALDVDQDRRLAILEHREDFPGVRVQRLTVREYPYVRWDLRHDLAAQVLGYTGEIPEEQLEKLRSKGYQEGSSIGRAGIEASYEDELRGKPRRETVEIDPTGKQVGPALSVEEGTVGNDVQLTIDANIQEVAERSLQEAITQARELQNHDIRDHFETLKAPAGSVVVLDVRDGSVLAMASNPGYDPTQFVGGISEANFQWLNDGVNNYPLVNRATQGQYAPGSTFKLVTSVAMTRFGVRSAFQWINDSGSVTIGADKRVFRNAGGHGNGSVNLQRALTVSSDVYYYTAGNDFWNRWNNGDVQGGLGIQQVAREFGFGEPSGIELDESKGRIPDPEWKRKFADAIYETEAEKADYGSWHPGDNVNLSVGQGDLLVTPLQLANAYATFANGGTLWTPHLGLNVKDPATGKVVRNIAPKARRTVPIDPAVRDLMRQGFVGAVTDRNGTATASFRGFPFEQVELAGKTGTAQVAGKGDTSLFASFFPASNPQYVVVAVVEEAGFGAQTAAPIVRSVIEAMHLLPTTPVTIVDQGSD
jgi:penicillin-binding protein 2